MTKKVLVALGSIAKNMVTKTTTASACGLLHGETKVPKSLQKNL